MHRDSPIKPESSEDEGIETPRSFRALVESATNRRLASRRVALWIVVGFSIVVLSGYALFAITRKLRDYVASRPDQQLPWSKVELVPEPFWILGGKKVILDQARSAWAGGETLSLLDITLKELENPFKLSHWVKKVTRIERTPGALKVYLELRKPVAVVVLPHLVENAYPIDSEGFVLLSSEIDWIPGKSLQVRGLEEPLIQIWHVKSRSSHEFWDRWKSLDKEGKAEPDPMVYWAAKLAEFLQGQSKITPLGQPAPRIVKILLPVDRTLSAFLQDEDENLILWGHPLTEDEPGEPSPEARWKMLLESIDREGYVPAKWPKYHRFTRDGVELSEPREPISKGTR
jgi:hypothetical protein